MSPIRLDDLVQLTSQRQKPCPLIDKHLCCVVSQYGQDLAKLVICPPMRWCNLHRLPTAASRDLQLAVLSCKEPTNKPDVWMTVRSLRQLAMPFHECKIIIDQQFTQFCLRGQNLWLSLNNGSQNLSASIQTPLGDLVGNMCKPHVNIVRGTVAALQQKFRLLDRTLSVPN
ncbi:MAG: hypothetical protein O2820_05355 [Planctomycetota bacterium]|nr:hypothetical protein [Planctomycetota bacterium]MDA1248631.1 hypothetical protein [Planctomycetota bacterium]